MLRLLFISYLISLISLLTSPVYAASPSPHPCSVDPSLPAYKDYVAKFGPCPAGLGEFEKVVANVMSVIVGLGFVAMLVMLIMAGIKYLTSAGEPKAVAAAHNTVTWALLGILFMAIAWLLLQLIHVFTGIDVTIFDIKVLCGGAGLPFCAPKP